MDRSRAACRRTPSFICGESASRSLVAGRRCRGQFALMPPRPATRGRRPTCGRYAKLTSMLGRVIAGVLSTFLLAVSASAQCDYRAQFSGEYRASIFDIAIDNNDLWTASGYGVQLFDAAVDPPRLIATAGVPGVTRVIRESNGVAYAGGMSGI